MPKSQPEASHFFCTAAATRYWSGAPVPPSPRAKKRTVADEAGRPAAAGEEAVAGAEETGPGVGPRPVRQATAVATTSRETNRVRTARMVSQTAVSRTHAGWRPPPPQLDRP